MINPPIKPRKTISPKLLVCIIAGALLVLGLIFVLLLFYFTNGKISVATAFTNTFEEYKEKNELYNILDIKEITDDKEYTLEMNIDTEVPKFGDISIFASGAVKNEIIEINGDVDLSFVPPVEYTIKMDNQSLRATTPLLEDYQFVYDYTKENNGYLMSYISNPEALNTYFAKTYEVACNGKSADKMKERLEEILKEEFGDVRVTKILPAKYTIDNQEVNAKGYRSTIDEERLKDFSEKMSEYIRVYLYDSLKGLGVDVDAYLNRMIKQCEETKEATVTTYVYKNKLAAIILSSNEDSFEIQFRGGDYRVANMAFIDNNKEVLVLKTLKDGSKVNRSLYIPDEEAEYRYSFDTDTGNLNIEVEYGYEKYDFNMDIERKKDGLFVDIDYFDMGDTYFGGDLLLKRGAVIKEMTGAEFNIGTASEEAFTVLMSDVYDILMEMMGW